MTVRRSIGAALVVALLATVALVATAGGHGDPLPGERLVSLDWKLDGVRHPESRKVKILWSGRGFGCQYRLHRVAVRETDDGVRIKVLVHHRPMGEDEVCAAITAGGRAKATLERPLGNRKLRHAPTSDPG